MTYAISQQGILGPRFPFARTRVDGTLPATTPRSEGFQAQAKLPARIGRGRALEDTTRSSTETALATYGRGRFLRNTQFMISPQCNDINE